MPVQGATAEIGPGRSAGPEGPRLALPAPGQPAQDTVGQRGAMPGDRVGEAGMGASLRVSPGAGPIAASAGAMAMGRASGEGGRDSPIRVRDVAFRTERSQQPADGAARAAGATVAQQVATTAFGPAIEMQSLTGVAGQPGEAPGGLAERPADPATPFSGASGGDARTVSGGAGDAGQPRADLARHAAAQTATQIAEALRSGVAASGRALEVTLQPEELGRLRFVFSQGETGLTVTIQADRPEVLDMLRRNVDQLGADLLRQGHEDVAFAFAEGGDPDDTLPDGRDEAPGRSLTDAPAAKGDPGSTIPAAVSGLDLRL